MAEGRQKRTFSLVALLLLTVIFVFFGFSTFGRETEQEFIKYVEPINAENENTQDGKLKQIEGKDFVDPTISANKSDAPLDSKPRVHSAKYVAIQDEESVSGEETIEDGELANSEGTDFASEDPESSGRNSDTLSDSKHRIGSTEYLMNRNDASNCSISVLIMDPHIPAYPRDDIFYTSAIESLVEYGPTDMCVLLQTSVCRLEGYLAQGVDAANVTYVNGAYLPNFDTDVVNNSSSNSNIHVTGDQIWEAMVSNIFSRAGPFFHSILDRGRVRVTVLNHTLYEFDSCDQFYNPRNAWMSAKYWIDEFNSHQDTDQILVYQRDVFLCKPFQLGFWKGFAFLGAPWVPGKAGSNTVRQGKTSAGVDRTNSSQKHLECALTLSQTNSQFFEAVRRTSLGIFCSAHQVTRNTQSLPGMIIGSNKKVISTGIPRLQPTTQIAILSRIKSPTSTARSLCQHAPISRGRNHTYSKRITQMSAMVASHCAAANG